MRIHCNDGCTSGKISSETLVRTVLIAGKRAQVGACIVYTPERGIDLDMLRYDVKYLKKRYSLDVKGKSEGRLVIR